MLAMYTESIICPNCGTEFDVPVYEENGKKKYGFHFCNQCGEDLFYRADHFREIELEVEQYMKDYLR